MASSDLKIDFWNVGQGDCSVITLPDGGLVLIDLGPRLSPLIDWLADKPSVNISAVIITHNDADHIGSLASLLALKQIKFQQFYLLKDSNRRTKIFQELYEPLKRGSDLGHFNVGLLLAPLEIWSDIFDGKKVSVEVLFPEVLDSVFSKTANATSAIVAFKIDDEIQVVWPGDNSLKNTAEKTGGGNPFAMVGPHHGGPEDYKGVAGVDVINRINPRNVFISVGTRNGHSHPHGKYISKLNKLPCLVRCSQLTKLCSNRALARKHHILDTHMLLGLRPPRTGVACRGCWRLYLREGCLITDGLDEEHQRRIERLQRPRCLKA